MKDVTFFTVDTTTPSEGDTTSPSEGIDTSGVDVLPTFQFFKNGKKLDTFVGSDVNALKAQIISKL